MSNIQTNVNTTETRTSPLIEAIEDEMNHATTENGAEALATTLSPLLDLFGVIGGLRDRDEEKEIIDLFIKAYAFDPLRALKMLFYARDIRGGLGERSTFRIILKHLALAHPADVIANLKAIPEYGRWDDLFVLIGTPVEKEMVQLIDDQLCEDIKAVHAAKLTRTAPTLSLLAKWLPSENASSPVTKAQAHFFIKALGFTPAVYRKTLSVLRKALKVVEVDMSAKAWSDIDYSTVPSKASIKYRSAFARNDSARYDAYLEAVANGEEKINASTLYPYDIVRSFLTNVNDGNEEEKEAKTLELAWKNLPDYVTDKTKNFLVMADVSESMESPDYRPLSTSIGLAIYFAERSKGIAKNSFITFTDVPKLIKISPKLTLSEKIDLVTSRVGYDTDLEAAFDLILRSAVKRGLKQDELPSSIIIVSDMEINQFGSRSQNTSFTSEMRSRYEAAGYKMPTLVYWNVASRDTLYHASKDDKDVRFVSGQSPSVFKALCEDKELGPIDLMLSVIDAPRYSSICLGSNSK